jgi:hypothetical protein
MNKCYKNVTPQSQKFRFGTSNHHRKTCCAWRSWLIVWITWGRVWQLKRSSNTAAPTEELFKCWLSSLFLLLGQIRCMGQPHYRHMFSPKTHAHSWRDAAPTEDLIKCWLSSLFLLLGQIRWTGQPHYRHMFSPKTHAHSWHEGSADNQCYLQISSAPYSRQELSKAQADTVSCVCSYGNSWNVLESFKICGNPTCLYVPSVDCSTYVHQEGNRKKTKN